MHWRYFHLVGGLLYLLLDSRVVLSSPLVRSPAVSTLNTSHISPILRSGVVILRPSISRECPHDQFDWLVPTHTQLVGLPASPTVWLSLRSFANPGIGVIVWLLQRPAVLPTSALAAMVRTELQSVQLTHLASPACHRSILLTLPHLGPAASPVVCRRPHPLVLLFFLSSLCSSHTPRGSWTKYCIGSSSRVIKDVVPVVIFVCWSAHPGDLGRAT